MPPSGLGRVQRAVLERLRASLDACVESNWLIGDDRDLRFSAWWSAEDLAEYAVNVARQRLPPRKPSAAETASVRRALRRLDELGEVTLSLTTPAVPQRGRGLWAAAAPHWSEESFALMERSLKASGQLAFFWLTHDFTFIADMTDVHPGHDTIAKGVEQFREYPPRRNYVVERPQIRQGYALPGLSVVEFTSKELDEPIILHFITDLSADPRAWPLAVRVTSCPDHVMERLRPRMAWGQTDEGPVEDSPLSTAGGGPVGSARPAVSRRPGIQEQAIVDSLQLLYDAVHYDFADLGTGSGAREMRETFRQLAIMNFGWSTLGQLAATRSLPKGRLLNEKEANREPTRSEYEATRRAVMSLANRGVLETRRAPVLAAVAGPVRQMARLLPANDPVPRELRDLLPELARAFMMLTFNGPGDLVRLADDPRLSDEVAAQFRTIASQSTLELSSTRPDQVAVDRLGWTCKVSIRFDTPRYVSTWLVTFPGSVDGLDAGPLRIEEVTFDPIEVSWGSEMKG